MASNDSYPTGNPSSCSFSSPLLLSTARHVKRHRSTSAPPSPKVVLPVDKSRDDAYISTLPQGSARNSYRSTNSPSALNLNPALLLNPKGYGASQPASREGTRHSTPITESSAPVEFQFSTPNDSHAAEQVVRPNGTSPLPNGLHMPQTNGFGGMIERMNNTEHRTFVPQPKRRKTQNENDENMSMTHGFSGGSGGMLGGHIRERREAAANQPTPKTVEMVDLTNAGEFLSRQRSSSKLTYHRGR